ncbi:MAG TPA: FMN-binding glutamate synthase family protein, partial [Limnochordia bacterium]
RKGLSPFARLMFDARSLYRFPLPEDEPIRTDVVLGPLAGRPLRTAIPLLITGMAYGFALSEQAKIALAKGAAAVGTATNTGEGPYLESERKAARYLIVQYCRGEIERPREVLEKADMIEIQLGQGAVAALGRVRRPPEVDARLSRALGLPPGKRSVSHARFPHMHRPEDLADLVASLRQVTNGVPIGVKLPAGQHLEEELAVAVEAGVDVIALDGADGATKGSPPLLQDDFGLPTLHALCRAARYFEEHDLRGKVSLIISGGLFTPGDFLKALALGADAIYVGTIALWALTHTQVWHALPWEPPTQVVFYRGKHAHRLDVDRAALHLKNFLTSCVEEMKEGARALGKRALADVSREDLFALDKGTAELCGVPLAWEPVPGGAAAREVGGSVYNLPGRPANASRTAK